MTLNDVLAPLEAFAEAEWEKVKTEAIKIEQEVEPVIESGLATAVKQFGQLAVQTVINLMGAAGVALSGGEKLNLTATTIKDAAVQAGVQLADADVTALSQNAYIAVMGKSPAPGETAAQEAIDVAEKAAEDVAKS